jgi:multiple sugar transport system permease protein
VVAVAPSDASKADGVESAEARVKTRLGRIVRPKRRWSQGSWWLYIVPGLVVVCVINLVPLVYSLYESFRVDLLSYPELHGFTTSNYVSTVTDPVVQQATVNTLIFTVVSVAISLVAGMVLALLVDGLRTGKRLFRTVFFMPMLMCSAVIGVEWRFLLNDQSGPITWLIHLAGLHISPLGSTSWSLVTVTLVDAWQWTPFVFLVLTAGLQAQPLEPLESARVDGANSWQMFRHITLPSLYPLIGIAILFRVTWDFRGFSEIYTLTGGGPGYSSTLLGLRVYEYGWEILNVGAAEALSVLMVVLMGLLAGYILWSQYGKRRGPASNAR